MTRIALALAGAVAASTMLTGCGDPCAGLKLTERDRVAIENGGEVEREGQRGVECEASDETGGQFKADE